MYCRNVGGVDRAVRLALGAVLLPTGIVLLAGDHGHGWIVTIVGSLILASGALGFCPPYVLFGISTARRSGTASPCARRDEPGCP